MDLDQLLRKTLFELHLLDEMRFGFLERLMEIKAQCGGLHECYRMEKEKIRMERKRSKKQRQKWFRMESERNKEWLESSRKRLERYKEWLERFRERNGKWEGEEEWERDQAKSRLSSLAQDRLSEEVGLLTEEYRAALQLNADPLALDEREYPPYRWVLRCLRTLADVEGEERARDALSKLLKNKRD